MTLDEIKAEVASPTYDFLRTDMKKIEEFVMDVNRRSL